MKTADKAAGTEPASAPPVQRWRRELPTAEEVRKWRRWWVRWPGWEPHLVNIDWSDLERWRLHPDAEYAPCLPPEDPNYLDPASPSIGDIVRETAQEFDPFAKR